MLIDTAVAEVVGVKSGLGLICYTWFKVRVLIRGRGLDRIMLNVESWFMPIPSGLGLVHADPIRIRVAGRAAVKVR